MNAANSGTAQLTGSLAHKVNKKRDFEEAFNDLADTEEAWQTLYDEELGERQAMLQAEEEAVAELEQDAERFKQAEDEENNRYLDTLEQSLEITYRPYCCGYVELLCNLIETFGPQTVSELKTRAASTEALLKIEAQRVKKRANMKGQNMKLECDEGVRYVLEAYPCFQERNGIFELNPKWPSLSRRSLQQYVQWKDNPLGQNSGYTFECSISIARYSRVAKPQMRQALTGLVDGSVLLGQYLGIFAPHELGMWKFVSEAGLYSTSSYTEAAKYAATGKASIQINIEETSSLDNFWVTADSRMHWDTTKKNLLASVTWSCAYLHRLNNRAVKEGTTFNVQILSPGFDRPPLDPEWTEWLGETFPNLHFYMTVIYPNDVNDGGKAWRKLFSVARQHLDVEDVLDWRWATFDLSQMTCFTAADRKHKMAMVIRALQRQWKLDASSKGSGREDIMSKARAAQYSCVYRYKDLL